MKSVSSPLTIPPFPSWLSSLLRFFEESAVAISVAAMMRLGMVGLMLECGVRTQIDA